MSSEHKISLQSAILINLNIMAGAGIFVNIVDLTKSLGLMSGLLYFTVGLFMFPLVFTFARLVQVYPSGAFYVFARPISPFWGFISTWCYFFGKLASATFLIHVSATFLQKLSPGIFGLIPLLSLDILILTLFVILNSCNVRIGVLIQRGFFISKFIPLIALIVLGAMNFDMNIFEWTETVPVSNFIVMLPLVLYCFSGFEAACSVSRTIENASKNAPRAIFYSFFSIILIYFVFQTLISMMLASNAQYFNNYVEAFDYLSTLVPCAVLIQKKLVSIISLMIGFSAMGAAYGLLFSNAWNLFTLAEHNHVFASTWLTRLSVHRVPLYAVFVEGVICLLFILLTAGAKIPLQQTATLGCTFTYTISTLAYLLQGLGSYWIGFWSLLTCTGFIVSCVYSAIVFKFTSLYLFAIMFLLGLAMFFYCANCKK